MRSALRDAEVTPPADGWARLERELGPAPRISVRDVAAPGRAVPRPPLC